MVRQMILAIEPMELIEQLGSHHLHLVDRRSHAVVNRHDWMLVVRPVPHESLQETGVLTVDKVSAQLA